MEKKTIQRNILYWKTGFLGIILILSGIFFLLTNFILPDEASLNNYYIGILFFIAGIVFAFFQGGNGGLFWFIIPAGAAITTGITTVILGFDQIISFLSLSFFCVGMGATFLLVFFFRKSAWWAILPWGVLFGMASWILHGSLQPQIKYHPIALILWIGISFLFIYVFSVQRKKMRFSLITGAIIIAADMFYFVFVAMFELQFFAAILLVFLGISLPLVLFVYEKVSKH
ncbi:MAG: hypothetical protein JW904_09130 [Spirochaetales bacterium]|nr:hypothetical protein [Spirochaetales bacterium]